MPKFTDKVKIQAPGTAQSGTGGEMFKKLVYRITDALLTAASTSQTLNGSDLGGDFPANGIWFQTDAYIHQLGSDDLSSAVLTIDVGTAANPDLYVDALDVHDGGGTLGFERQAGDATPPTYPAHIAAGVDLQVVVTSDVNVNTIAHLDAEIIITYFLATDPYA